MALCVIYTLSSSFGWAKRTFVRPNKNAQSLRIFGLLCQSPTNSTRPIGIIPSPSRTVSPQCSRSHSLGVFGANVCHKTKAKSGQHSTNITLDDGFSSSECGHCSYGCNSISSYAEILAVEKTDGHP